MTLHDVFVQPFLDMMDPPEFFFEVVIGGLMKNVSSDNVGSVPGVSDAPVVGELFKQKRKLVRRSELVILLRPIVIEKGEIWSQMINESADRVRTLRPVSLEQGE